MGGIAMSQGGPMRRTKIVCTLGPSSNTPEIIRDLIDTGMDVARLNFSHGDHAGHEHRFRAVRAAAEESGRNVAVMMDLQGPRIRTGRLQGGPVELVEGNNICVTTRQVVGDQTCISVTYPALAHDVRPGDRILIADGSLELCVERSEPPDVHCRIVRGGILGEKKGINLPGVKVSEPSVTPKDLEDLAFGLKLGVDYVALSFVRSAEDVRVVKRRIHEAGGVTRVIAKIERPEALQDFDAITCEADGIMVARGDLGVEINFDDVPQIQKDLIVRCNRCGVPVITATQMLESMTNHPRPTRAEVTDVANAIYDGTDAVMLSAETAAGQFPVEAVRVMAAVAAKADLAVAAAPVERRYTVQEAEAATPERSFSDAIGRAVRHISESVRVKRIVCFTMSGYTAAMIARYRPRIPITAFTLKEEARRRCALFWGVDAVKSVEVTRVDDMVQTVDRLLSEHGLAAPGDTVIIVAGTPLAVGGRTNLLKLHVVGDQA